MLNPFGTPHVSARPVPLVVSFDIDGTMEFGDPPGPVPAEVARALFARGIVVGVASDWPLFSQPPLWAQHAMTPHFFGGKNHLDSVRAHFPADRYIHVGDTKVDESYARRSGFEFVDIRRMILPVTMASIVGDDADHQSLLRINQLDG